MQLVVNTFGASVRKEGERFVVRAGEKQQAVSAHKVSSLVITTGPLLSTDAIEIAKDKTRTKVAKRCLDYGLYRVQKSVFLGDLAPNRVAEIVLMSRELLNVETDAVYVFPMCREDFGKVQIVGQGFDGKFVAGEVRTHVI